MSLKDEFNGIRGSVQEAHEQKMTVKEILDLMPDAMRKSLDVEYTALLSAASMGLDTHVVMFPSRLLLVMIYEAMKWKPRDPLLKIMSEMGDR